VIAAIALAALGGASSVREGYRLRVSVGGGRAHVVQIDTGSVGVVVPRSVLGSDARDTGTPGRIEYTSSGKIFTGEYYMAPLRIADAAGRYVRTTPIRILAIDAASCDTAHHPSCVAPRSLGGVGMMGVGFARGTSSPANNAFLHATDPAGRALAPAYIVRADAIVLGAGSAEERGFAMARLTRGSDDWNAAAACFRVPARYCGTVLVDTGIAGAIVRIPKGGRPLSPAGVEVDVPADGSALAFRIVAPVRWSGAAGPPFINTGRSVLGAYDYLYDARVGAIGFLRRP